MMKIASKFLALFALSSSTNIAFATTEDEPNLRGVVDNSHTIRKLASVFESFSDVLAEPRQFTLTLDVDATPRYGQKTTFDLPSLSDCLQDALDFFEENPEPTIEEEQALLTALVNKCVYWVELPEAKAGSRVSCNVRCNEGGYGTSTDFNGFLQQFQAGGVDPPESQEETIELAQAVVDSLGPILMAGVFYPENPTIGSSVMPTLMSSGSDLLADLPWFARRLVEMSGEDNNEVRRKLEDFDFGIDITAITGVGVTGSLWSCDTTVEVTTYRDNKFWVLLSGLSGFTGATLECTREASSCN